MTKEEKILKLYNLIDGIIDVVESLGLDRHFFIDAEKYVVYRLRSEIFKIDDEGSETS
ncbi:hypothetical protein [Pedobacter terrae]|nr:hypothetical protein [Pedobacter terrae]